MHQPKTKREILFIVSQLLMLLYGALILVSIFSGDPEDIIPATLSHLVIYALITGISYLSLVYAHKDYDPNNHVDITGTITELGELEKVQTDEGEEKRFNFSIIVAEADEDLCFKVQVKGILAKYMSKQAELGEPAHCLGSMQKSESINAEDNEEPDTYILAYRVILPDQESSNSESDWSNNFSTGASQYGSPD